MDWIVPPWNSYVETLTLSVKVSKDGALGVIRFRWGPKNGTFMMGLVPSEEETSGSFLSLSLTLPPSLSLCSMWRDSKKVVVLKPGRQPSLWKRMAQYFEPGIPKLHTVRKNFCCLGHSVHGILTWHPEMTNTPTNQWQTRHPLE